MRLVNRRATTFIPAGYPFVLRTAQKHAIKVRSSHRHPLNFLPHSAMLCGGLVQAGRGIDAGQK
jgi:hypothetical protein